MSRRSQYRAQRSRDNTSGGVGMAMYRKEERERKMKENNRISKRVARELGAIGRSAGKILFGASKSRRRRRR